MNKENTHVNIAKFAQYHGKPSRGFTTLVFLVISCLLFATLVQGASQGSVMPIGYAHGMHNNVSFINANSGKSDVKPDMTSTVNVADHSAMQHAVQGVKSARTGHCQHNSYASNVSEHIDQSTLGSYVEIHQEITSQAVSHESDQASNQENGQPACQMDCCESDCQCAFEHCFNSTGLALIQPAVTSIVVIARTTAVGQRYGELSHSLSGQFRPPKVLFTA